MITYRAVRTEAGDWAVEWDVDGLRQGFAWGRFACKGEALFAVVNPLGMEAKEAARPVPPGDDEITPHCPDERPGSP